ncbi:MAG: hypothetical protein AB7R77_12560 [Ilumatobacteraceae bacterium]
MPGPLPQEHRRRRNAPTIPTTSLPVDGRKGRPPNPPSWVELGAHGKAFWVWAWGTPQAAAWNKGHHVAIAHRASLEDDLAALVDYADGVNLEDLLALDTEKTDVLREISSRVDWLVKRLKAVAGGRSTIISRIQTYDAQLGLDPKGMAALRWKIVDDTAARRDEGGIELGDDDGEVDGVAYLDRFRKAT